MQCKIAASVVKPGTNSRKYILYFLPANLLLATALNAAADPHVSLADTVGPTDMIDEANNVLVTSDLNREKELTYLKKTGGKWFAVTKGADGIKHISPASQPVIDMAIEPETVNSGLFSAPKTFPVGSWPEAVAIGDVNNDGRKDVVLTTSYYFDTDNCTGSRLCDLSSTR